jgi:thiosulfate dehydrogenase [quinone] large subunit
VSGGEALKSYWERALATTPAGKPVIAFDWYRAFIQGLYDAQAWSWFAPIIAWAEVLVGVALILGLFTGLAAFGGSVMNWSFVMAGTASTNMLMFAVAALVILAWKTAGWYGLDRWVLPLVGTPWAPGRTRLHRPGTPHPVRT